MPGSLKILPNSVTWKSALSLTVTVAPWTADTIKKIAIRYFGIIFYILFIICVNAIIN